MGCVNGYAIGTYDGGGCGTNSDSAYFVAQGASWVAVATAGTSTNSANGTAVGPNTSGLANIPSDVQAQLNQKAAISAPTSPNCQTGPPTAPQTAPPTGPPTTTATSLPPGPGVTGKTTNVPAECTNQALTQALTQSGAAPGGSTVDDSKYACVGGYAKAVVQTPGYGPSGGVGDSGWVYYGNDSGHWTVSRGGSCGSEASGCFTGTDVGVPPAISKVLDTKIPPF